MNLAELQKKLIATPRYDDVRADVRITHTQIGCCLHDVGSASRSRPYHTDIVALKRHADNTKCRCGVRRVSAASPTSWCRRHRRGSRRSPSSSTATHPSRLCPGLWLSK